MPTEPTHDFWHDIIGDQIPSQIQTGAFYKAERFLGGGGMSVALFATRFAPDGETPVVLKLMKPEMAFRQDQAALLAITKEAVSLGRLNDRVPTTPFVVRYIDSGNLRVEYNDTSLRLPWIAIEYVHGGKQGTTLEERLTKSIEHTSYAFDPERAAHAVECLAQGLTAIHDVNVIHRDMKPANVLCSGFDEYEIFKIADFGIARPLGVASFGAVPVGTPGYMSPEQWLLRELSTSSDVFGLACIVFFLLTGEEYFTLESYSDGVALVEKPFRKSITASRWLHPRLRDHAVACSAIDVALANATALDPSKRTASASLLAQMIVPTLRSLSTANRSGSRTQRASLGKDVSVGEGFVWALRRRPDETRIVRAAAWDGAERCLMVTSDGPFFWDGIDVRPVVVPGLEKNTDIHFALRVDAGTWLVGGSGATAALCSFDERSRILRGPNTAARFVMASGNVDELIVFVGVSENEPPTLYACTHGRFLKPATISRAAFVTSLSRLDDAKWLVTGRTLEGEGFVVIYEPLQWEVQRVKVPACRAYLGSAAQPGSKLGIVVGTQGKAARFDGETISEIGVDGEPDLSAVAIDGSGRLWMGSSGALWVQKGRGEPVHLAHQSEWEAPFVAIYADIDRVLAMTASGGILEGRLFG